jgi:hypothetical protein
MEVEALAAETWRVTCGTSAPTIHGDAQPFVPADCLRQPLNSNVRQHMHRPTTRILAFVAALACTMSAVAQSPADPIEESGAAAEKLGYKTVTAALEGLKALPGISINVTQPDGWTIAVERDTKAMWSFTPASHYAYPAVVRREIKQLDGNVYVEMVALCQAEKAPCDKLIREFQALNQRMSESIRSRQPGPK